jgi:hypothetical protein
VPPALSFVAVGEDAVGENRRCRRVRGSDDHSLSSLFGFCVSTTDVKRFVRRESGKAERLMRFVSVFSRIEKVRTPDKIKRFVTAFPES